ncbi:PH domain-containing protein [Myroides sp. R163-1]|uniref:PH domain-containing protein n=1 Tax=Myroides sp. R163-1 TaxID=2746738 RepID=UPI002575DEDD|nr:PH domain-containing protein [Myroides sp. R163-1]
MKIKYRSKISLLLAICLSVAGIGCLVAAFFSPERIISLVLIVTAFFIGDLYVRTYYEIDTVAQTLHIRSSFLLNQTLTISSIRKIEESNSLLSAPALSMDRLEVHFNIYDSILLSPKDKNDFITTLQKIHPDLIYIEKKNKKSL